MRATRPLLVVVMSTLMATAALAAVRVHHVEPRELHAGWTEADPNAYVGQSFVACADSLVYSEFLPAEA